MASRNSDQNDYYLQLMEQLIVINTQYDITDFEVKLLDEVCRFYNSKKLLTVSDLLKIKQLASSAKIHLSMKRLIKKKMIELGANEEDERIRYVRPSTLALRRLDKLNQACKKSQ